MRLNKLIKERRLELGLSQAKLAKMLGYPSPQFISNIESGRCNMPRKKLRRLCRGLLLDSNRVLYAMLDDEMIELCKILGLRRV